MTRTKAEALEALGAALADLDALEAKRAGLRRDLSRALALGVLWPGLWTDHGPGSARTRWIQRGPALALEITGPDGTARRFPWSQVPDTLKDTPQAQAAQEAARLASRGSGRPGPRDLTT